MLVDPTDKEEKVMAGKMIIGMNKHREICTMQMTGDMLLLKDQVIRHVTDQDIRRQWAVNRPVEQERSFTD